MLRRVKNETKNHKYHTMSDAHASASCGYDAAIIINRCFINTNWYVCSHCKMSTLGRPNHLSPAVARRTASESPESGSFGILSSICHFSPDKWDDQRRKALSRDRDTF